MPVEIAHYLNRSSAKKVVERVISPMFDAGFLIREFPNTPAHPRQRYSTSPKGYQEML